MDRDAVMHVTLTYSPVARKVCEVHLALPAGSSVLNALHAAGVNQGVADVGIWGRVTALDASVHDGDRIEIYRPLQVDPKVARRQRFKKQGAKAAGLFASRRAGAKAGY